MQPVTAVPTPDINADSRRAVRVAGLLRGVLQGGENHQPVSQDHGMATESAFPSHDVVIPVDDFGVRDEQSKPAQHVQRHLASIADAEGVAQVAENSTRVGSRHGR